MRTVGLLVLSFVLASQLSAAVIGTNTPAQPLTAARVAALPARIRPAWEEYLKRSKRQWQADQAFLRAEMRKNHMKESIIPPTGLLMRALSANQPQAFYREADALRIADIVVSFQTPAGGWSKNLDLTQHARAPGEGFAPDNRSLYLGDADFDAPRDTHWNYVGTFDNGATVAQLRYLAKVISAVGTGTGAVYRASFLRGLDYIFAAQYPNGGWPQVWPLQGGYHDAITYNDNAMINVLNLLTDVAAGTNDYAFVPRHSRELAEASVKRGVDCILATQIIEGGRRTVWCQQHAPLTLEPESARNYEMPSQCASESDDVMMFLMRLPHPDSRVVNAVYAAAAWFEKTKINGVAFRRDGENGRRLVPAPGNGPIWARYYQIGTDRPIFGDRDKTIHDDVNEISLERRNGYSWYNAGPARALEEFAGWSKTHPLK
ncbi:MAG TPA: pectate lyase [Verrucomicrobiae bacterium]|nr:pectate lyase [Verrucomicrobiae bacterium]